MSIGKECLNCKVRQSRDNFKVIMGISSSVCWACLPSMKGNIVNKKRSRGMCAENYHVKIRELA